MRNQDVRGEGRFVKWLAQRWDWTDRWQLDSYMVAGQMSWHLRTAGTYGRNVMIPAEAGEELSKTWTTGKWGNFTGYRAAKRIAKDSGLLDEVLVQVEQLKVAKVEREAQAKAYRIESALKALREASEALQKEGWTVEQVRERV